MKAAIVILGLCLSGAQSFSAQVCCAKVVAQKSSCGNCGDSSLGDAPVRPDCCTSLEAQKDVDLTVPRNTLPEVPVVIDLLPVDSSFAPWSPVAAEWDVQLSNHQAEGPPLYLRNEFLLI